MIACKLPLVAGLAALAVLLAAPIAAQTPAAQEPLSFDRYRTDVERVFIAPRGGGHGPGASPCVTCHVESNTPMKLQELETRSDGSVYWTEDQSRKNFEVVSRLVVPGRPERSRLLLKALAVQAGGAPYHVGGKFFNSQADPEWRRMADWVKAATPAPEGSIPAAPALDFEFFRTCVQQLFISKRAGRMECVNCHSGGGVRGFATALPADRPYWTLDESKQNFEILSRYIDAGHPESSRFLMHPLAIEAGGDPSHNGGRRWTSKDDREWQMLAAWVRGETPTACTIG
jgi:hypothetical protein